MEATKNKTHTFHVEGMHCHSCVLVTESELKEVPGVAEARASLKDHSVRVSGDFGEKSTEQIAADLSTVLAKHGYRLGLERKLVAGSWSEFKWAVPIALGLAAIFIALQKLGIVNLVDASEVSYGTALVIGAVASVSTCMAVVGGLVLSMSATFAREGDKVKPQLLFHIGRLAAFFLLGGVIGAVGLAFSLNTAATVALNVLVGLVMLILGINLLNVFHFSQKLAPTMPKFISRRVLSLHKLNHRLTPALVGVATFFLPCGFTQSMQIFTLSAGGFWQGGLLMLAFALGTLPALALASFSSLGIRRASQSGIFFKTAGLVVIMFALLNLVNSLVIMGLIPPVFNF